MKNKVIITFFVFLIFVALFGASIALVNQYLRVHDMTSPWTHGFLSAILAVVYYNAWRWFCRKLDKLNK